MFQLIRESRARFRGHVSSPAELIENVVPARSKQSIISKYWPMFESI